MAETPSAFFSAVVVTILAVLGGCSAPSEAARAFFVFGDSLVDNGNNNYLATTARADAPPYGIDSPSHRPSGRFSNGRNIPDIISEQLGAETTLPYLSPELRGEKLLVGANFASAGIGILNDTGIQFRLYELGARRVIVTGTGPLGCVPAELALRSRNGQCDSELQRAAGLFNPQLVQILTALNRKIGSDVFVSANAFGMHMNYVANPQAFGK
ncbi:GDSL esterase lipase [Musa troglodytarum]|uniref:GDSL esterase lipase n=1 Tax=Musa troglodytarum TaxID=320322 RepID=A0A9E7JM63_9LILI|nr:GDSL esterase lipase [Musa troglodytarum]